MRSRGSSSRRSTASLCPPPLSPVSENRVLNWNSELARARHLIQLLGTYAVQRGLTEVSDKVSDNTCHTTLSYSLSLSHTNPHTPPLLAHPRLWRTFMTPLSLGDQGLGIRRGHSAPQLGMERGSAVSLSPSLHLSPSPSLRPPLSSRCSPLCS